MKNIKEVYPDLGDEPFYGPGNYGALVESMGFQISIESHDNYYQGDSRYLLADGDRRGYLNFGWGSCSGCDALQACSTYKEIDKLRDELSGSIKWFGSAESALQWINTHDWEGDYSYHADNQKDFLARVKFLLETEIAG